MNARDLRTLDRRHHLHAFTDSKAMEAAGGTRLIDRGEGVYVYTDEGKKLLDGMSGLWCVNVGYGRRQLAEAAAAQMLELSYYNTFFACSPSVTVELSAKLATLTPEGISQFLFCSSGSEANDTIIKMVRLYWNLQGRRGKKTFIAREYSYHGVTLATASLSGLPHLHPQWDLPLANLVSHIEAPYWFKHGGDRDPEEYGLACARALETRILELGADNVAAFIGEPVFGAGGVMVPPSSYWPEIQRICRKYDVLLVSDEVVCGFGRTGSWFGAQTYGIEPDLMTMAKGLTSGYVPMAAVGIHERVASVLRDRGGEIAHGYTYSGHPVTAAVALANLRLIEEEKLVERVRDDVGPYLQAKFAALRDHPLVGEVRGVGLLAGVEIVKDKKTRESWGQDIRPAMRLRTLCFEHGIVMRAARDCVYCSPPFVITHPQLDELVDTFRRCLDLLAAELGVET